MSQPNVMDNINQTLKEKANQFVASVAALVNSNPKIAECTQKSILSSCLIAASLDLPINQNLGFAYIIPYDVKVVDGVDDKGKQIVHYEKQAQFQMGAKGFKQLAIRTGKYKYINDNDVREGEYIGKNRLTGEYDFKWIEDEAVRAKAPIIGYLAYIQLTTGFEKTLYMTIDELNKHGMKYSKTFQRGFGQWKDDPDAMARKTVVKLLISKYGLMTITLQTALEADQAIINDDGVKYIDNQKPDPAEIAAQKETERIIAHITNSKTIDELEMCFEALASQSAEVNELYKTKEAEIAKGKK